MGTFGIGIRKTAAAFGGMSQQSVQPPASPGGGTTPLGTATIGPSSRISPSVTPVITSRTINPERVAPAIVGRTRGLPNIARFIEASIPPYGATRYREDVLNLSQVQISNGKFEIVEKNGISVLRPEIISMMNFVPVNEENAENSKQLILSQYQATELRAITLEKLVGDIRTNRNLSAQMDVVKNEFAVGLRSVQRSLADFADLIQKIDNVKESLNPKSIESNAFVTELSFLPLIDFYERKMQYAKSKYYNFSDTKIINQLTVDLKKMLEGYSLGLFDLTDPDRSSDISPISIDKSYTQTNGFSFSPASVRSTTVTRNAFRSDFFNQFLNSLPGNSDDRTKLLVHFLSRELRISKQMSITPISRKLREVYLQTDSGNPFDNILGDVGNTIFDAPRGQNTIASLTRLTLPDPSKIVLPFESIYVDSEADRKSYIPGSTYFVDSILTTDKDGFNTAPYTTFVDNFKKTVSDTKGTIEELLDLKAGQNKSLTSAGIYDTFLKSIVASTSGLNSPVGINRGQAICVAIFELAYSDTQLKNMLFEYLLLLGLSSVSRRDEKGIFVNLASEVGQASRFQYVVATPGDTSIIGQSAIRPYLEQLSGDIENKVFSLINTINISSLNKDFAKSIPSPTPLIVTTVVSGLPSKVFSVNGGTTGGYQMSFGRGEIKETLLSNITTIRNSSTNLCNEFKDLAVKLDQAASDSSNPVYLLPDFSGRTRQNFLSTSTVLLFIFETICSLTNRYTFCSFNKGTSLFNGSLSVETYQTSDITKVINEIVLPISVAALTVPLGLTPDNHITSVPRITSPISIRGLDISREVLRTPESSGITGTGSPGTFTLGSDGRPPPARTIRITGLVDSTAEIARTVGLILKTQEFKKTLLSNKKKLKDEDNTVRNILNIFNVIGNKLSQSKDIVVGTFTKSFLDRLSLRTNLKQIDMSLVKNPSQIRVSSWLLDHYNDKLSNTADTSSGTAGFIISDRIPSSNLAAMFSMLSEPYYVSNSSNLNMKIMTVGIPSGFSGNISDRILKTSIGERNFKEKQFDVISVDVYKRDAKFDDLVFKPQKFIFDLSLFPAKNFIPPTLDLTTLSFQRVVQNAVLRDYESLQNKADIGIRDISTDVKYDFLSFAQQKSLVENHVASELFDLYFKLVVGLTMNEETFSTTSYTKVELQDSKVFNLLISYLKEVKGKNIPSTTIEQLLINPDLDQETKDTLRLLSYGNVMFQSSFIKNRILQPKLFDRVFNLPLNIDLFEIDVDACLATESGKNAYTKNSVQNMIKDVDGRKYLRPKEKNDMIFEDYFISIETNLRAEV